MQQTRHVGAVAKRLVSCTEIYAAAPISGLQQLLLPIKRDIPECPVADNLVYGKEPRLISITS